MISSELPTNNNPFTLNILQAAEDDGAFCWLSTVFQTFSNFFFASEEDESGMLSLSEDTDDLDDLRGAVSGIVFTTSQFKYHFFSSSLFFYLLPCTLLAVSAPFPSAQRLFPPFFPPSCFTFSWVFRVFIFTDKKKNRKCNRNILILT